MKKLKDPEEPLRRFFSNAKQLGPHLGPILYQLPPRFPINLERFETFLRALPSGYRHTVEFRDTTWYDDRVYAMLERYKVALCLHDMQGAATERIAVGPFVYVRFHHGTKRYGGRYPDARLESWAEWLADRARSGMEVFAYFNNDTGGHAPRDAVRLRQRLLDRLAAWRTIPADDGREPAGAHP
jgi:uncharacterized protein YecE (DUF72 family)